MSNFSAACQRLVPQTNSVKERFVQSLGFCSPHVIGKLSPFASLVFLLLTNGYCPLPFHCLFPIGLFSATWALL
jgi:hypothetical protein